ncbi:thioredoxin family protein [Nocardiopsis sp. EMB25]|uniref:DF family (seleno)protein n=1 Tax=Nocardiopsis sp. EMB25 TaxID=2835867 RepID=UPI0022833D7D|nr:thioredoxin family protein [Nocardiopsis sp. EMB25]MCY9785255.1 thioredoxin family protein [Nocardiopsis sp. EMB25]
MDEEMNVRLLFFDGCPNWRLARERLHQALTRVGLPSVEVELVVVGTEEEAHDLHFPGSPTIRVNGRDPFDHGETFGLACRVYPSPEGLSGAPTAEELVRALTEA